MIPSTFEENYTIVQEGSEEIAPLSTSAASHKTIDNKDSRFLNTKASVTKKVRAARIKKLNILTNSNSTKISPFLPYEEISNAYYGNDYS